MSQAPPSPLDRLVLEAEAELESALRGASLCSVSRKPQEGASDVKFKEGRWYALRDIQRHVDGGFDAIAALQATQSEWARRTPTGEAWTTYRAGALAALQDATAALGVSG